METVRVRSTDCRGPILRVLRVLAAVYVIVRYRPHCEYYNIIIRTYYGVRLIPL